jgi:hypothetical protein
VGVTPILVRTDELSVSMCLEISLDSALLKGKIIVWDHDSNPCVAKEMVIMEAGGAAMVLANRCLVGDVQVLPTLEVVEKEGNVVKVYVVCRKHVEPDCDDPFQRDRRRRQASARGGLVLHARAQWPHA